MPHFDKWPNKPKKKLTGDPTEDAPHTTPTEPPTPAKQGHCVKNLLWHCQPQLDFLLAKQKELVDTFCKRRKERNPSFRRRTRRWFLLPRTHQTTPQTASCPTATSWICEPSPIHASHNTLPHRFFSICKPSPIHTSDDTSVDTLHIRRRLRPDSPPISPWICEPSSIRRRLRRHPARQPPLDLRTLTQTHIKRHRKRHPAPPKTNPENLRPLTPIFEVKPL